MLASLLVTIGYGACSDGGPGSPDGGPGNPDDPSCHWDCFGQQECEDGQVRVWSRGAVPCSEWTGDCPNQIEHTCEKGCRSDLATDWDLKFPPWFLCEEHRPKQAGDACASDSDCEPFTIIYDAGGGIQVIHLSCEAETGRCVEIAPPDVEGAGDACNLAPADVAGISGNLVLVDAPGCATRLCAVDTNHDEECVPQGCTIQCSTDRDCPQGTLCLEARNESSDVPGFLTAVCVTGFVAENRSRWHLLECPDGATP